MTTKFANAHTKPNREYSNFHKSLIPQDGSVAYALHHIYNVENSKFILKNNLNWSNEDIDNGVKHITIDVFEQCVYIHIPAYIFKKDEKIKIKGISRFVSKIDYVQALIHRSFQKADPCKIQKIDDRYDFLVSRGSNSELYEVNLYGTHITCSCHAYSGLEKAFLQDTRALKALQDNPLTQGQIPDKHIFAVWKYLGAHSHNEYRYALSERRDIFQEISRRHREWEADYSELFS